jgi:hypothetical protein
MGCMLNQNYRDPALLQPAYMSAHLHLEADRFNPKGYPELLKSNQVEVRNTKRYPEVQKIHLYN